MATQTETRQDRSEQKIQQLRAFFGSFCETEKSFQISSDYQRCLRELGL